MTTTDWAKFYSQLSPPTCEVYDKLANLGMALIVAITAEDNHNPAITLAMGHAIQKSAELYEGYPPDVFAGILSEIVEAHNSAKIKE